MTLPSRPNIPNKTEQDNPLMGVYEFEKTDDTSHQPHVLPCQLTGKRIWFDVFEETFVSY